VKCAARGSLDMQACIDSRKKLPKQQYLPHMSLQYGELWPTSGRDYFVSLGQPASFNGFCVLAALLHGRLCGVEQRVPPIFGRAAITLGIGPHSSYTSFFGLIHCICQAVNIPSV